MFKTTRLLLCMGVLGVSGIASATVEIDGVIVDDVTIKSVWTYTPNQAVNIRTWEGDMTLVPQAGTGVTSVTGMRDAKVDGELVPGVQIKTAFFNGDVGYYNIETIQGGYTFGPMDNGEPEPPPVTDDIALDISAMPNTVVEGSNVTISWTSANVTSCTTRLGNAEWQSIDPVINGDGSAVIYIASTAGVPNDPNPVTFRMRCVNEDTDEEIIKGTHVTVTPAETPAVSCDAPSLSKADSWSWNAFFHLDFPSSNQRETLDIGRTTYSSIFWDTDNVQHSGAFTTTPPVQTPSGRRLVAISQCPGDFDVAPECKKLFSQGSSIQWSTEGGPGCQLESNSRYYLNVTFTDGESSTASECTTPYCQTEILHVD
ncbi:hypothetical protein F3N42_10335 [Marinihelvus fidelis]|uniref:Uncharacterized protein n=1 Tax=Marinihelvus fidelis TaxID=2613842 RepID=A0A5N0T712_9GAMM|nr:hypothetical protein [Marinihelvus fidelis]KAA9130763.1 hypothetical protein F3N42_10335 [Marinihelvus fidelis]